VYSTDGNPTLCKKDVCDPTNGGCQNINIDFGAVTCSSGSTCKPSPQFCAAGEQCGFDCDENDDDCVVGKCDWSKTKKGGTCPDKVCCTYANKDIGDACLLPGGATGMCDSAGVCLAPVCGP